MEILYVKIENKVIRVALIKDVEILALYCFFRNFMELINFLIDISKLSALTSSCVEHTNKILMIDYYTMNKFFSLNLSSF